MDPLEFGQDLFRLRFLFGGGGHGDDRLLAASGALGSHLLAFGGPLLTQGLFGGFPFGGSLGLGLFLSGGFGLCVGLGLGLRVGFGLGIGFGLGFGIRFGLGGGVGFGLGLRLGFGFGLGLRIGCRCGRGSGRCRFGLLGRGRGGCRCGGWFGGRFSGSLGCSGGFGRGGFFLFFDGQVRCRRQGRQIDGDAFQPFGDGGDVGQAAAVHGRSMKALTSRMASGWRMIRMSEPAIR